MTDALEPELAAEPYVHLAPLVEAEASEVTEALPLAPPRRRRR